MILYVGPRGPGYKHHAQYNHKAYVMIAEELLYTDVNYLVFNSVWSNRTKKNPCHSVLLNFTERH